MRGFRTPVRKLGKLVWAPLNQFLASDDLAAAGTRRCGKRQEQTKRKNFGLGERCFGEEKMELIATKGIINV